MHFLDTLQRKLARGERLNADDGLHALSQMPLGELMRHAHRVRMQRFPEAQVSFVFDTNPNHTNVCATECIFCAFWRKPGARDAYALSPSELAEKVALAHAAGATTVLFQGGHHPDNRLGDWLEYIRAIRAACPDIHVHPFSPAEIAYLADQQGPSSREILNALWEEGIRTLPGGGAEILNERVRKRISPKKCSAQRWLDIMQEAHEIGFTSTATMMYGHVETDEEVIEHLLRLRALQDRTSGFSSFIPWSFKPGRSTLGKQLKRRSAAPLRYLRIIATARLLLDNFPHIQSSWFSESVRCGQLGLLAGADDFGGLLFEENVLKQTGHQPKTNFQHTLESIRAQDFIPVQRDSFYRLIRSPQ